MDIDDDFSDVYEVEVSVNAGKISGVGLSTMVQVSKSERDKAVVELRRVIRMLRAALPVAELKAEDLEYEAKERGLALDRDGQVKSAPANLLDARRAQSNLKRAMNDGERTREAGLPEPPQSEQSIPGGISGGI